MLCAPPSASMQLSSTLRDVVAVEVDRHRQPIADRRSATAVGIAVGRDVDAVVEVGDGVVGHDVARAVDLHRVFRHQLRVELGQVLPGAAGESHQVVRD